MLASGVTHWVGQGCIVSRLEKFSLLQFYKSTTFLRLLVSQADSSSIEFSEPKMALQVSFQSVHALLSLMSFRVHDNIYHIFLWDHFMC
jgi:hypothetical protein